MTMKAALRRRWISLISEIQKKSMKILFQTSTLAILSMVGIAKHVPRSLKASLVPYPLLTRLGTLAIIQTGQYYVTCHPQDIKTLLRINEKLSKRHGNV